MIVNWCLYTSDKPYPSSFYIYTIHHKTLYPSNSNKFNFRHFQWAKNFHIFLEDLPVLSFYSQTVSCHCYIFFFDLWGLAVSLVSVVLYYFFSIRNFSYLLRDSVLSFCELRYVYMYIFPGDWIKRFCTC